MSIRIGILGYGNLGRGVECAPCEKPAVTAICWKVPARQKYGADILSWDMNHLWKLPVQTVP